MPNSLERKIIKATKWSSVAEFASKVFTPISTIVLARLLSPESFGIMVTATMVVSFAEIFTDAGFQKYLIQHDFFDDDDKYKSTTIAFWCNFLLSLFVWGLICLLNDQIALFVGCPGYGIVICVASICIPLASFSSIQMALYKRDFDFRTLFFVRIVGLAIPLCVTIPLAFVFRSFWALILGMVLQNVANAIFLTVKSSWKPNFYFDIGRLKDMLSFSIWSMIEAVSIWLTNYVDIFIVGSLLSSYYLGIYRTSMTTVAQIVGIVTSITTPILFSALSRLQSDKNEFQKLFFKFQKIVGMLVIPLGFGIFLFSDLIVQILLGPQWIEASSFIGLWGLTSSVTVVLSHYSSEVYRAKGKPKVSVLAQFLHIVVLLPVVFIFAKESFQQLCVARSLIRLELVLVNMVLMLIIVKISPLKMIVNIFPALMSSTFMLGTILLLPENDNVIMRFVYVFVAIVVYFSTLYFFPKERYLMIELIKNKVFGRVRRFRKNSE